MSLKSFQLSVAREADSVTITCTGELDIAVADELRVAAERELERRPQPLVLDLGGVRFVDSTGFRLLLRVIGSAVERRVELRIVPSRAVRRMFELAGVAQLAGGPAADWPAPLGPVAARNVVA